MKILYKLLFLLTITACAFQISAQDVVEDTTTSQPIFKAHKFDSKCYVGIEGAGTQILKDHAAMYLGFSLNWVINHKFVVTARYWGITSPVNVQRVVAPDNPGDTIHLNNQFAGLAFSYILFNNKKFSLQPEMAVGWSFIKYYFGNSYYDKNFAEIIPAIYGTYNVTKYFRFGVGINYRQSIGANLNGLKNADISGLSGLVFIRVGTF